MICNEEPQCPIATTGKCLNGFDPPTGCPHYITSAVTQTAVELPDSSPLENNVAVEVKDDQTTGVQSQISADRFTDTFSLYSSQLLSDDEASEIARQAPSLIIALAGLQDCGKTTLLAETIHGLQEGPLGSIMFAGSRTLRGFDERCHKSRIESGNETPHAGRTIGSFSTSYFHLRLRENPFIKPAINIFIADLPGEDCEEALQSQELVSSIHVLHRCDYLALLFDGGRLSDLKERSSAMHLPMQLLERFVQDGQVGKQQYLNVLFSKWDSVTDAAPELKTMECVEEIKNLILTRYKDRLADISFHNTAAWSSSKSVSQRFGLAELVKKWMVFPRYESEQIEDSVLPSDTRYFSRFNSNLGEVNNA